jgi:hypothetical protein
MLATARDENSGHADAVHIRRTPQLAGNAASEEMSLLISRFLEVSWCGLKATWKEPT